MGKQKQHKEKKYLQESSVGMALVDAIPVLCFIGTILLLGSIFGSPVFLIGGLLCTFAGGGKALWKMIMAVSGKNVRFLADYFRYEMAGGCLLMLLSLVIDREKVSWSAVWENVTWFPGNVLLILGFLLMVLMGFLGAKMDRSSKKANWLEQSVNCVAQLSFLTAVAIMWFGADYYRADVIAQEACESSDQVAVTAIEQGWFFDGEGSSTAVVLYPGAKVEASAYAPLMRQLAEDGIDGFLVEMPYRIAFFGKNRMDEIMKEYSYDNWYLAGHSLGGIVGTSYAAKHAEQLDGLIYLASYPDTSLKESGLSVLSLYGSEDQVLRMEKMKSAGALLPDSYEEYCIEGGNHAQFGSYGLQKGDGEAAISAEEQRDLSVEKILEFCER